MNLLNVFAPILHALRSPGQVRKWLGYAVAIVGALLAEGLIPAPWNHIAAAAIAVIGSQGVYLPKNDPSTKGGGP